MPIEGGLPTRWTYENDASVVNSWTPDGKLVYSTRAYSKVPDKQIVSIDLVTKQKTKIPLAQASEATYDDSGKTVDDILNILNFAILMTNYNSSSHFRF